MWVISKLFDWVRYYFAFHRGGDHLKRRRGVAERQSKEGEAEQSQARL